MILTSSIVKFLTKTSDHRKRNIYNGALAPIGWRSYRPVNCLVQIVRLAKKARQPLIAIGLLAIVWLTLADALWARSRRAEVEPPKPPSFVSGYVILLIMLGLGLAVICRSSSRSGEDDEK